MYNIFVYMQSCLISPQPVRMHNWEVLLHFDIHGQGKHLFGDGLAFWYTKERSDPGPVFGNRDFFTGLGVFFDTYSNHNGEHEVCGGVGGFKYCWCLD